MLTVRRVFHTCLLAAFCASPAARAELAGTSLDPGDGRVHILFVEGDRVHRARCEQGTSLYDHAHCRAKPASAPAGLFFAKLPTMFGRFLDIYEKDAQEAWIKLKQVDDRLFQLVNTQPTNAEGLVTQAEVEAATLALDKLAKKLVTLDDQIARLVERLEAGSDDAEALAQLEIDRADRQKVAAQRDEAAAALIALRKTYIEQRAATSDANFRDLVALSQHHQDAYRNAKAEAGKNLADKACAELMAARIKEAGYVWEAGCSLRAYNDGPGNLDTFGRVGMAFNEADVAGRTFSGANAEGRVVNLEVSRDGRIERIACHYPQGGSNAHFEGYLFVYGPNGLSTQVGLNNYGANVDVDWTRGTGIYRNEFEAHGFLDASARGVWRFELHSHFITIGGGSTPAKPATCSVTLLASEEN